MTFITDPLQLEQLYGQPQVTSTAKELDHLIPHYRRYIEASPFVLLATVGERGADCTPRGDRPGFVRIRDDRTLLLPDRRGNNRIDSLRNILRDPRLGLLFLIPGQGNTLRVSGQARISIDADLLQSFAVDGQPPRSVLVIEIQSVFFQCARAVLRSELWNPEGFLAPGALPSAGDILAAITDGNVGGAEYDRVWPERARQTLW